MKIIQLTTILVIVFIIVFLITVFLIKNYFDIPVVHWSNSRNECVKVVHKNITYDCTEIPEKYIKRWTK